MIAKYPNLIYNLGVNANTQSGNFTPLTIRYIVITAQPGNPL
jgi:hypothetical protein